MNILIKLFLSAFLLIISSHVVLATKLYKWVDDKGNISYQDQPPPENAKVLQETSVNANGEIVDNENAPNPVIVYTVPNCESCANLLARLVELEVPVKERNLDNNREAQQRILELSDSLIAPSMFVNDQLKANVNQRNLRSILEEAGYTLPKPKFVSPKGIDEDNDERYHEPGDDQ